MDVMGRRDMVMPPAVAKRSCRLIVRNLPFSATVPSLLEVFGKYGPVLELSIPEKPSEGGEAPKVWLYTCVHVCMYMCVLCVCCSVGGRVCSVGSGCVGMTLCQPAWLHTCVLFP
jgi:hypothetical protein